MMDFVTVEKGKIMADEKRLIDANALIKEANTDGAYGYVDAKQIADAPTIDAVEVVRCEFCKNAEPYDCTINGTAHRLYECKKDKAAIGYNKVVANNDFCSCGKRKEDDTDETCICQL